MRDEQLRILKLRRVARVRVDDELRVRNALRKRERVDRRDHDIVAAIHHEGCTADTLELREARPPLICRQSFVAARCAAIVCGELGGSTSFLRRCRRSQNAFPAAWLRWDGEKNRYRKASSALSPVCGSRSTLRIDVLMRFRSKRTPTQALE